MKKKTEQVINEICKSENVKKYILEKLVHIMIFSGITIGAVTRFFENLKNWEDITIGILTIAYSLWVFLKTIIEMEKIYKTNQNN